MGKAKKILIIIGVILALLIIVGVLLKNFVLQKISDNIVATQVEKQYDQEKTTSSKNNVNIEQFKDDLNKMSDTKYENIGKMVNNATINEIQELLSNKKLTCEDLVIYYLKRIEKYDVNKLNTIIFLNPDAINIAREKDKNPDLTKKLYGIPVILKDNIATGDKMPNTAGAYILKDSYSDKDSFVASKLREEGAILLAKANMSEWAYYMSSNAPSGYSALGGQTHNPYGKFDVGGSSSGSAAAVAANFAPIAIGSETCGSMIYPSSQNSVVGIKPSIGLVSRDRIIPITEAQDTAGVIAKNVEDSALVLNVISGYDPNDYETKESEDINKDYSKFLNNNSLKDLKIAIIHSTAPRAEEKEILSKIETELTNMGAIINKVKFNNDYVSKIDMAPVLRYGYKSDLKKYLDTVKVYGVNEVKDIVEFNNKDLDNRAPFGQDLIEGSSNDTETTDESYKNLVKNNRKFAGMAIDDVLNNSDVILSLGNNISNIYAPAGYPSITVPAGYKSTGEPIGLTFTASKFQEGKLISIASVYEKNTKHRIDPNLK